MLNKWKTRWPKDCLIVFINDCCGAHLGPIRDPTCPSVLTVAIPKGEGVAVPEQ